MHEYKCYLQSLYVFFFRFVFTFYFLGVFFGIILLSYLSWRLKLKKIITAEPLGQFQPNLAQSIFSSREFKFNRKKNQAFVQRRGEEERVS